MKYDVKRGLRDLNGKGVVAGLTEILRNRGQKRWWTARSSPCDGKLYYRGYDVEQLVGGTLHEKRFGFEGGGLSAAGGPSAHRRRAPGLP